MMARGVLAARFAMLGSLGISVPALAQQPETMKRIGVLLQGVATAPQSFLDELRALGWTEGVNFKFERRIAERPEQLPALAAELVALKVDLILAMGTPATRAAQQATATIPIFFNIASDPVENGFVASMARPGGNLTGVTAGVYVEKMFEVLKQALPRASNVAFPVRIPNPQPPARVARAASALGLRVRTILLRGPDDLPAFFVALRKARPDAVVIPNETWIYNQIERIAAELLEMRMPAVAESPRFAQFGGLLAYGPQKYISLNSAKVNRLLRGANPADIPVEQPTNFVLAVNLKTAKAFGLTIPPSLLARADEVIR